MDFSDALLAAKAGSRVARAGWNGKDMFIFWLSDGKLDLRFSDGVALDMTVGPHMMMKTAQGNLVPWLCSQTDMAAEDWAIV